VSLRFNVNNAPRAAYVRIADDPEKSAITHDMLCCGDSDFRIGDHPTRTQRDSDKSRRICKMLATITNPFGPSA
jgi:hypothetical protein